MLNKMMTGALISFLLFVASVCVGEKSNNLIVLSDVLNIRYLAITKEATGKEKLVILIRESSHNDIYSKIIAKSFKNDNIDTAIVLRGNDCKSLDISDMKKGVFIFQNHQALQVKARTFNFKIDQEIYLYEEEQGGLFEVYEVNAVKIFRKLGHFNTSHQQSFWNYGIRQR